MYMYMYNSNAIVRYMYSMYNSNAIVRYSMYSIKVKKCIQSEIILLNSFQK